MNNNNQQNNSNQNSHTSIFNNEKSSLFNSNEQKSLFSLPTGQSNLFSQNTNPTFLNNQNISNTQNSTPFNSFNTNAPQFGSFSSLNSPNSNSIHNLQNNGINTTSSFGNFYTQNPINNNSGMVNSEKIKNSTKFKDLHENVRTRLNSLYQKIKTPSFEIQRLNIPEIENESHKSFIFYKKVFKELVESEGEDVHKLIKKYNFEVKIYNKEIYNDKYISNMMEVIKRLIEKV